MRIRIHNTVYGNPGSCQLLLLLLNLPASAHHFYFQAPVGLPFLHARLDLHIFVATDDDADVDVARVGLLRAEEVVDPGLDVGAQPGDGQAGALEPVFLALCSRRLVAAITFKPERQREIKAFV